MEDKLDKRNKSGKEKDLELRVFLPPLSYRLSKVPLVKKIYLRWYEHKLRKQLPEYKDYKFIFE